MTLTKSYLTPIIEAKRRRLMKESRGYDTKRLMDMDPPPSFYKTIQKKGLSIIGEIKKASPSKGLIREAFDPVAIAKVYNQVVEAISVLTEEDYFLGKDAYLEEVSRKVTIPTLCKDFIISKDQIYRARELGASCVLLIVAILDDQQLTDYMQLATSLKMDALVEVHNQVEVQRAVRAGARIIGINNRNLESFRVDLGCTVNLAKAIPSGCLIVSESGIRKKEDIIRLKEVGIDGVLVGEWFMRHKDIPQVAKEMKEAYET